MRKILAENKAFFGVIAVAELALIALSPLALALDRNADAFRALFGQIVAMAELQYGSGAPRDVVVEPGQAAAVGTGTFTSDADTTVSVTADLTQYCVTAETVDDSATRCWRTDQDPAEVAGTDPEA